MDVPELTEFMGLLSITNVGSLTFIQNQVEVYWGGRGGKLYINMFESCEARNNFEGSFNIRVIIINYTPYYDLWLGFG